MFIRAVWLLIFTVRWSVHGLERTRTKVGFRRCLPLPALPSHSTSSPSTAVILTGSTGVLGAQVAKELTSLDSLKIYGGYRDRAKAQKLLQSLKVEAPKTNGNPAKSSLQLFEMEVNDRATDYLVELARHGLLFHDIARGDAIQSLSIPALGSCQEAEHIILINNAGICLSGLSLETMRNSIAVNTFMPIYLASQLLNQWHPQVETICYPNENQLERLPTKRRNRRRISVVNISSGDGEQVYLHPSVASVLFPTATSEPSLPVVDSLSTLQHYVVDRFLDNFDSSVEFAFSSGGTPSYSLSKALLNRATQLMHEECQQMIKDRGYVDDVRVVSVCPGNFASSMSTAEELMSEDLRSVSEAAKDVLAVALDFDGFPGGRFYRWRESLPW